MSGKIAVIGGGIAGLTAACLLRRKYDVWLFEKDDRLGGNACTITSSDGLSFDIAAAVFGRKSYPNFVRLLKELGVKTCSLSGGGAGWRNLDTGEGANFSWSLRGMIAQRFAMFYPRAFYEFAAAFLNNLRGKRYYREGKFGGLTMEEAFETLPPYKGETRLMFMFAMCLVSSMYYDEIMRAPAPFFFGKMDKHSDFFENPVFNLFQSRDNTRGYVEALASGLGDRIVLSSRIASVARGETEVVLKMEDGSEARFDKVVFACNADQALKLLERPTDEERRLLGPWKYKDGPIVVHKDRSSFPEKEYYNLFTFLYTNRDGRIHTSVNGHIRNLRSVPDDCKYISSQHPNFPIAEDLVEFKKVFRTPVFDTDNVATIKELPSLNGKMNSYYCGSHFGYGLHEDCVTSANEVAKRLGAEWA
jgi:predicted NAD/FAD-binding protein